MSLNLIVKKMASYYTILENAKDYNRQKFVDVNERPIEYRFVFEALTNTSPTEVLDVGTGVTSLPSLMKSCGFNVTAVDNIEDYWPQGMFNKHYHALNQNIIRPTLTKKFDLVTCISVLEHIEDFDKAVNSMSNLLNDKGHLVITFPYNESSYCKNVYDLEDSNAYKKKIAFKTQAFSRSDLDRWSKDNGLEIITQEYWSCFTGKYWSCGERKRPFIKVGKEQNHQISCVLFRKNK